MSDDDRPTGGASHDVVAGRYELLEIVGAGGMGVVHRARDRVLDRVVALKLIRGELVGDDFVRRFEREAALLARVRSPYIVVVFDYGSSDGRFYLVTDYLPDGDLARWIEEHGPMPPARAVPLVAALAEGLGDAHALGVIHRDVKPGNVLLWRRGQELHPVLADFGIAVAADLSLTQTGAVAGSPPFMAPERHLGLPATEVTDVYAMGCLLFNLLAGVPPYEGTSFQAAHAHINEPVPTLPAHLPGAGELDAVVARCMAKQPEDRYRRATDLAAALRDLARPPAAPMASAEPSSPSSPSPSSSSPSDEDPPAGPCAAATVLRQPDTAPPVPAATPRRRAVLALVVGAVLALVGGIAAAAVLLGGDEEPRTADRPSSTASSPPGEASPTPSEPSSGSSPSPETVRPAVTLAPVPNAVCADYRVRLADGSQTTVPCAWYDVFAVGLEPGAVLTVQWRFGIDGRFNDQRGSKRVQVAADGTAEVGQHEAASEHDGLCPSGSCAGGFPVPDAATHAIVSVLDAQEQVMLEERYALARFR